MHKLHRPLVVALGLGLSLVMAVAGCKKKGGDAKASGGKAGASIAYKKPPRGADTCSVLCGKESDASILEPHRSWFKSDEEYRKTVEKTYQKKVNHEKKCRSKCQKLLAAGGPSKELVGRVQRDCSTKKSFEMAMCIGKLNQEMRKRFKGSAPEW